MKKKNRSGFEPERRYNQVKKKDLKVLLKKGVSSRIRPSLKKLLHCNKMSGRRWIRTTEGINQQIYSLPHLA
ncbi:MAG: hypothetical protein K2I48_04985, partial [Muribaculaceae bacterium]|nr:hypothetical protein [Muribaculaceae bacterium]